MRSARVACLLLLLGCGSTALAQDFAALARIDPAKSQIRDIGAGLGVTLGLSQPVPWRVFTLDDPRRLVVDFRELDWRGMTREALLNADRAIDLRFGGLRPGWSRLVVDLAAPMVVAEAGMAVDPRTGTARVTIRLEPTSDAAFAAASGAPEDPEWDIRQAQADLPPPPVADGRLVVAIDPGHGGIDPGAEREGVVEAAAMLALAVELAEAIDQSDGMVAVLTRDADIFVPLAERMTIARAAGADLFLSLHADALEVDEAQGASVYTLSSEAVDSATERMAQRHDRGDLLAGLDLTGQDDTVATVLMELARLETGPASERLATALVAELGEIGDALNSRPWREAKLAVLSAADFPSVLVEVGFLSNQMDRERLATAEGRSPVVAGLLRGIQAWAAGEEARRPLIRQ